VLLYIKGCFKYAAIIFRFAFALKGNPNSEASQFKRT